MSQFSTYWNNFKKSGGLRPRSEGETRKDYKNYRVGLREDHRANFPVSTSNPESANQITDQFTRANESGDISELVRSQLQDIFNIRAANEQRRQQAAGSLNENRIDPFSEVQGNTDYLRRSIQGILDGRDRVYTEDDISNYNRAAQEAAMLALDQNSRGIAGAFGERNMNQSGALAAALGDASTATGVGLSQALADIRRQANEANAGHRMGALGQGVNLETALAQLGIQGYDINTRRDLGAADILSNYAEQPVDLSGLIQFSQERATENEDDYSRRELELMESNLARMAYDDPRKYDLQSRINSLRNRLGVA